MIIVKILLILIASGLIVGLTGTIICYDINSLTNIDADRAIRGVGSFGSSIRYMDGCIKLFT